MSQIKVRRALLSVSDKTGIVELAQKLQDSGAELVATGQTAAILKQAGLSVTPIEMISGSPEAFKGRMKTLSFPVCSGILYRRKDQSDENDLKTLGIQPIDCVVVNFYPFESTLAALVKEYGENAAVEKRAELIEKIDIGGPTLVRAAAKNSPDVLVLTSPLQYSQVIHDLKNQGTVSSSVADACAQAAWDLVRDYDSAIANELGRNAKKALRYGENPHQKAYLQLDTPRSFDRANPLPIAWDDSLTPSELSYNNILDVSAAYDLISELTAQFPGSAAVVIIKHNNPCGVAVVPKQPDSQMSALMHAWDGDPTSAFGGVVLFSDPLSETCANWLSERFIELVAAPELFSDTPELKTLLTRRKNLKAVRVNRFERTREIQQVRIPGGIICQAPDLADSEELRSVTHSPFPTAQESLARFGIAVTRVLKSNAIGLVREIPGAQGSFQLVGAGQGQPNRIDALKALALPRALEVLRRVGGSLSDCLLISDAFFPFRDCVEIANQAGIRFMIQPGGSLRDSDSIRACDEFGLSMAFTGVRHFRH